MKKTFRRVLLVLLALMVLFGACFVFINTNLRKVLVGLSKARVESVAAKAMYSAILEILSREDVTRELLSVHTTADGVYLLQADSARLNAVAAECANNAQRRIMELGDQGVSIPLGTVLGIPLFAGMGPKLTLEFTPAGSVASGFESEFRSAGINQTLHRITLSLTSTIRIILPGESHTVSVTTEASIAESVIVGDVPQTYTNVESIEDALNLIPTD